MTSTKPPAITNPRKATPVQIDTRLAELDHEKRSTWGRLRAYMDDAHRMNGERPRHQSRNRKSWATEDHDTIAQLEAKLDTHLIMPHNVGRVANTLAKVVELKAKYLDVAAEFQTLDDEYMRRPWRRYIGVADGHIHSGMWCVGGSIRPATIRTWAPMLAGKEVADAVAELGPILCTHCFPDAPVEWQTGAAKTGHCAGAGRSEKEGSYKRVGMNGYGTCQECGTRQIVTSRGVIRAHKPTSN